MSYILDALKKLEHEKFRKSRGGGIVNISGALFDQGAPRDSGPGRWKILMFVAAAVLVTFGATWLLLRPAKNRELPAQRFTAPTPPVVHPVAVAVPTVPPTAPEQPVLLTSVPAVSEKPRSANPVLKSTTPQPAAVRSVASGTQVLRKRQKEHKGSSLAPEQLVAAPTDVVLSGIAWQDERRARRAVVNGFLMQEGGVVSGARITDIYPDRVRFSLSGKVFEIPLVASGVSPAGK
jgi:general secretion pathway protein B